MNIKCSYYNRILFWIGFIFVAVSFGYIYVIFPMANDDWRFLDQIDHINLNYCLKERFYYDNVRFGNYLGIFLLLVPKWIPSTICAISFILGLWLMLKVTGIKQTQWKEFFLLSCFIWIVPMWEDAMFCQMYAFNYIVPLPLLFGMIYIFEKPSSCHLGLGVFLGFLLGIWHEAYAIVFLGGAICYFIFNINNIERKKVILTLSVFIGSLWFVFTPAIYYRQSFHPFTSLFSHKLFYCWIYFPYLILWIYTYRKDKNLAKSNLQMFALASGSILYIVLFTSYARAFMPSIFVICCALTVIIKRLCVNINSKLKIFFSMIIFLFTGSSLLATCIETFKIAKITKVIENKFFEAQKNEKYVFAPIRYQWNAPALTLRRPDCSLLLPLNRNMAHLNDYCETNLMIVPEELQDYSAGKGVRISDNPDLRLWKGHIVSSNVNDTAYHHCHIDYGLRTEYTEIHRIIFTSNEDKQYVYMLPKRSTISTYLGDPVFIELNK